MIYGIIGWFGIGFIYKYDGIVKAQEYCEGAQAVLERTCRVRYVDLENSFYLNDNDPKHHSKIATEMFERLKLPLIIIPPQSPDLNPVGHVWAELKRRKKT